MTTRSVPFSLLLLIILTATVAAADLDLIRAGQPLATIVTGPGASPQALGAAAELQTYLKRLTGAELPVAERAPAGRPAILVGLAAAAREAKNLGLTIPSGLTDDFADEGYVVAATGRCLLLAGNETEPYQGTWYAVSDFLGTLGCRWYFPGEFGEVVPRLRDVTVAPQRRTVRPEFRVRDTWYSGHLASTGQQQQEFATWKRRNRMSQTVLWLHCGNADARFLQNPVDDSTYRLLPKDKYWESHPEFYAMQPGGARNDRFLCMSQPGALQAATDTVLEQFRTHPDHHTFAFSPPDAPVLCHCPDCTRAMHGGYNGEGCGDVSDAYFGFVFKLADAVGKQRPDRWVTTMAYYNRCRPPEGVEGRRKNLLIQLASIQQCVIHSYADRNCPTRRDFAAMLKRWQELSAGQVFYEYDPHDWSHSQRPAWRAPGIAEDFRLLKQGGGWGYSNEGQMAWMATGLNYYVRARLAWDLSQDPRAIVREWCTQFFGPAAEPMFRYYTGVEDASSKCPAHFFAFTEDAGDMIPAMFPVAFRRQCGVWLAQAARAAVAEPYASRVRTFRVYFDRVQAFAAAHDAAGAGDYTTAVKQGEAMLAAVQTLGDSALLQDAGPWGGAASGAGVRDAAKRVAPWTDGQQGKLVTALPTNCLFRADPASEGLVQRWYRSGAETRGWRPLRMDTAWHHQGVVTAEGRPYAGVGWYRVRLNWTGSAEEAVGLYVPGLRGKALWLWVNGQQVGYLVSSDDPPVIELNGVLQPGANDLVFRVDGSGGLVLPPFIFRSGAGRLTEIPVFPGQWLFRVDPQDVGQRENWQRPDLPEGDWRAIPVPAAWEQTPVGPYDGYAWYRVRFRLPAEVAGKELVLRFGGVDEQAWVYLDGKFIGEHTEKSTGETVHQIWDKPFVFKLGQLAAPGEHVLAVRVHDSLMAGGLHRPVRLFAAAGEGK